MAYVQRGLNSNQEQNQQRIFRDTRPIGQRVVDFFKKPEAVAAGLVCVGITGVLLPAASDIYFLISIGSFIYSACQKNTLPFRMPMRSGKLDHDDVRPGTTKASKARGIYFLGNEKNNGDELWFANEDMRTHVLIFGSTGSGKTEFLVSLSYNALMQSSGFIYVDGKGDNSLYAKIFSMVRSMGRDDDMLLINFMTGAKDIIGPQEKRLSNTLNPFNSGSSSMLTQLVVSMMDSASGSSDGDMWKGRAIAFVEALMKILVAMRDAGNILLDANTIRNYFHLNRLEAMVVDKAFIRDGQDTISLEGLPETVGEPIKNYLSTLPGYNMEKKGKQVSQVLEQHGFITMQLTRVFTSLADTYGHIMRTPLAEVDLKDVVLNRRILVVLLPALEKSPEELSNLGKVIIATLKAMMASGLGNAVEGSYADLIQSKPTNSKTPYLCVLDEYGYYAVKGFAVVPAQARSLGFSVVFAGQDLPAFQKASKEEAASIGANTNIKICMKLEDPIDTWDFFMKSAGESYVSQVESFQVDTGSLTGNYADSKSAKLEKRARIDLLDLKEQREGEAHILFKSKIVRARVFYTNPQPVKTLRLNHFIKVEKPQDADVIKMVNSFSRFEKTVNSKAALFGAPMEEDDISTLITSIHQQPQQNFIDNSILALQAQQQSFVHTDFQETVEEYPAEGFDHLDIFLPMNFNEHLQTVVITDDIVTFRKSLLNRSEVRDQIEYLQRLCGKTSQQAVNIALEVVTDMQKGTFYPPEVKPGIDAEELSHRVERLIEAIQIKKEQAAASPDSAE